MKKKVFIVLIILFIFHLVFRIYSYRESYLSKYDHNYWKERYLKSQWVANPTCTRTDPHINPKTCKWDDTWYAEQAKKDAPLNEDNSIGDDGLYTYAGWEYLTGHDPTLLNAEIPPLGKYVIGLSILIFGNQNIFALVSGLFVLGAFFALNKIVFQDSFLAFLPVYLLSFDPLFYTQLQSTYLDLFYLSFLLLTFIFFLKERFIIAAIFLGCMIATKTSIVTFLLVVATQMLYLFYMKHKVKIIPYIFSLVISMGIFLLTYAVFFVHGNSLQKFLGVQKWIYNFYVTGAKGDPLAPIQMIFTGQWSTWWGQLQYVSEWNILWPLSFIASSYYLYYVFSKRKRYQSVLFGIWIVIYFVFLTFIPIWPRYLLVTLPFMYNLAIWVLSKNIPLLLRRFV